MSEEQTTDVEQQETQATEQPKEPTKVCKYCGSEIPENAKVCPNCRKKQKHTGRNIFLIILGVLVVIMVASCIAGSGPSDVSSPEKQTDLREKEVKQIDDRFNQIETAVANLNQTGYGDFNNEMKDQESYCDFKANDLTEKYGTDNELVNLIGITWTCLGDIAGTAGQVAMGQKTLTDFNNTVDLYKAALKTVQDYQIPQT